MLPPGSGEFFHGKASGLQTCIDELAAVLTQEGADESVAGKRNAEGFLCYAWGETDLPVALFAADRSGVFRFFVCEWFGDPKDPGLPAAMEQLDSHDFREGPLEWTFEIGGVRVERVYGYEALTAASVEPRAAEGAGTGDFTWHNPAPFKSAAITGGESKTMMAGCDSTSATECSCPLINCPVHTYRAPNTTAAAAVPAGGDAVAWRYRYRLVTTHKWSKWEFIDEHGNAKLQRMLRDELTTPDLCEVESLYRVPAPRGGVTEAMVDAALRGWYADAGEGLVLGELAKAAMRRALDALSTTPAAQAQDAGPKARHWHEAIMEEWLRASVRCDHRVRIEQDARALAAKEAK
jgi:hypothetical protein